MIRLDGKIKLTDKEHFKIQIVKTEKLYTVHVNYDKVILRWSINDGHDNNGETSARTYTKETVERCLNNGSWTIVEDFNKISLAYGQRIKFNIRKDLRVEDEGCDNYIGYVLDDIVVVAWNITDGNDEDGHVVYEKSVVEEKITNGRWVLVDEFNVKKSENEYDSNDTDTTTENYVFREGSKIRVRRADYKVPFRVKCKNGYVKVYWKAKDSKDGNCIDSVSALNWSIEEINKYIQDGTWIIDKIYR